MMMFGGSPAWVVWCLLVVQLGVFLLSSVGQAFVLVLPTTTTTTTTRVTFSRSSTNEQEESTLSLSADDWWQRGKSLQLQNDLAQAALALQKAIELHGQQGTRFVSSLQTTTTTTTMIPSPPSSPPPPPPIDWLWDLGQTWAKMGYVENAVATFQQILLQFFELEEEQGDVHHQNHTNTITTTSTTTTTNSVTKTTRRQVKVALANVLLDGLGRKQDALDIFTEVCQSSNSSSSNSRPQPLAVMAGVTADSMGRHEVAHALYWQGCTSRNETNVDPETALHLYTSCLRQGNVEKAAQVRNRLLDHYASSVDYVLSTRVAFEPSMHYFTYNVLQLAMQQARLSKGLVLEFGVYHGKTIRIMADYFAKQKEQEENIMVHGFDTFTGIPRDWHYTPRGSYSTHGTLPAAPSNVQYHVGTFAETLPAFLKAHPHAPVRFMNIDCDLYASTKDVLDALHDRIVPGTIIVFDEYILNPHWQDDEFKAFQEAVAAHGWKYEYCSISLASQQAVVRIL